MTNRRELNVRELLELERQIYQESIDRELQQQKKLNAGILEDFVRRCRPFEADRERELQVAQYQYKLSEQDALSLFEFDLQQANDVFQFDRQQLKRKLLDDVQRRRRRIEKRLKMLNENEVDRSNLKARQKDSLRATDKLERTMLKQQLRRAQRRARKSFNFRHLSGILPTPERIVEDVIEECGKLQRNREPEEALKANEARNGMQKVEVVISADGQKLICCRPFEKSGEVENETFCVGDAVVLLSSLTEEDFHGFISAITAEEVKLVLVCGSHVRVALTRLRSGQCALQKQSEVNFVPVSNREGKPLLGVATSLEELLQDPPDARRRAAAVMNRLKRKTTIDIRRGF